MEELDFIQPKKVVGEMIPMSVIDDIKADIEYYMYSDDIPMINAIIDSHIKRYRTTINLIKEHN